MEKGIQIYLIDIDELSDEQGVTIMSLVDKPAVEIDFLKFNKTSVQKYAINEEKKIITGIALRADYPIPRIINDTRFCVKFTPDTIMKIVRKFMKEQKTKEVSLQHDGNHVEGIYLIESFILNDHIKVGYPEFSEAANGSWIVSYKVDNEEVWNRIKQGEINGFSVEIEASIREDQFAKTADIQEIIELITILEREDYD